MKSKGRFVCHCLRAAVIFWHFSRHCLQAGRRAKVRRATRHFVGRFNDVNREPRHERESRQESEARRGPSGVASLRAASESPSPSFASPRQPAAYYSPPPGCAAPQPVGSGKRKVFFGGLGCRGSRRPDGRRLVRLGAEAAARAGPGGQPRRSKREDFPVSQADADPKATEYLKSSSRAESPLHSAGIAADSSCTPSTHPP